MSSSGDPDIRFDSYSANSTDGENILRIYFDGTDFRAYGKKAGADAVSKKLGDTTSGGANNQSNGTSSSITIPKGFNSAFFIGFLYRVNNGDYTVYDPSYTVKASVGTVTKIHSARAANLNGTTGYQRSMWVGIHKITNIGGESSEITLSTNGTILRTMVIY